MNLNPNIKKSILIAAVVLVVVVAVLGVLFGGVKKTSQPGVQKPVSADAFRPDEPKALPTLEGGTREILSTSVATPETNSSGLPADIAIPQYVSTVGIASTRSFNISGNGGRLAPNTIVVNELDVVKIIFTAVDQDYDFNVSDFAVSASAKKGETVNFQLQATPFGEYKITCNACRTPIQGKLIVNKK